MLGSLECFKKYEYQDSTCEDTDLNDDSYVQLS